MFEGLDSMVVSSVAAAVVMTCAHSDDVTANAELKAFADTLLLRFANQGAFGLGSFYPKQCFKLTFIGEHAHTQTS
jgi:hypothetical protein